MPLCCILVEQGKVIARQCTSERGCPPGFIPMEVADCKDCPPFPAAAAGAGCVSGGPAAVLQDMAQRLAYVQGQVGALTLMGQPATVAVPCGGYGREPAVSAGPLLASLRAAIGLAALDDGTVGKLTALVDAAEQGSQDLGSALGQIVGAAVDGLAAYAPGAFGDGDDPAKVLCVRSLVEVVGAVGLIGDLLAVTVAGRPPVQDNRKCKGRPLTCQPEPRWRCIQLPKGGCLSVGPAIGG